jgi:hypothetical protein
MPEASRAPAAAGRTGTDDAAATEIAEATNCLREMCPFSALSPHPTSTATTE